MTNAKYSLINFPKEARSTITSASELLEEKFQNEKGETCIRNYIKSRFIGKGGFAKCYEIKEIHTGKIYAAKVIEKSTLLKGRAQQKLMSEIKIHRSMNHPNIVKFETFFEDTKKVYILLELCPNQTLKEILKRRKKLHELEVQCYLRQIIPTLQYIHSKQVIHRDLKLGNLFLGKNLEIKVGDFGLAAKLDFFEERRKTICGTPNYIAPEVLDSKITGHSFEADIWSLGVIIYTLLIGYPPFETPNVKLTYEKIKKNDYKIPEDAQISDEARSLIHRILVLNPSKRLSLKEIYEDHFMTKNIIPITLPLSTLNEPLSEEYILQHQFDFSGNPKVKHMKSMDFRKNLTESTEPTTSSPKTQRTSQLLEKQAFTTFYKKALKSNEPINLLEKEQISRNTKFGYTTNKPTPPLILKPQSEHFFKHSRTLAQTIQTVTQQFHRPQTSAYFVKYTTENSKKIDEKIALINEKQDLIYIDYYADYSEKYGYGYVMTNGDIGFYYNDITNLIWIEQYGQFGYSDYFKNGVSTTMKFFSTPDQQSADVIKKVKILNHFLAFVRKNFPLKIQKLDSQTKLQNIEELPEIIQNTLQITVSRMVKTKNAICFKLNNGICQTFFNDKTQMIICFRRKQLIFIDKTGTKQKIDAVNDVLINSDERINKRYMYTISLLNLLNSCKNNNIIP